jgi:hypothetical protein
MQVKGLCEACNDYTLLVDHHWITDGVEYHANICSRCNGKLCSYNFGLADHQLPNWETQKQYIAQRLLTDKPYHLHKPPKSRGKPLANCAVPVTKENYEKLDYLRNHLYSGQTTYNYLVTILIDCYVKRHKIKLPTQEAVDKFIKEHTLEAKS